MKDLKIKVSEQQLHCLNKVLNPYNRDYLQIKVLVDSREINKYISQEDLVLMQDEEDYLKQKILSIFDHCSRNGLDLAAKFQENDERGLGYFQYNIFKSVLQLYGIELNGTDFELIKKKFDATNKGVIQWKQFIEFYE